MVRRKSVLSGSAVAVILFVILSPLDDFLLVFFFSKYFLQLDWTLSILIAVIVGSIILGVVEIINGEG